MVKGKDNSLLVEFEAVVDLDLAMFKFIRDNYYSSPMVNHEFLALKDEREIILNMLSRSHINPLEYIIPDEDTTNLYYSLLNNEEQFKNLLMYAKAYDTFPLMVTFLREASSVSIDILCRNKIEEDYIHSLNDQVQTLVKANREDVNLKDYSIIFVKYFPYLTNYQGLEGKHIFIPAAKFNMEPGKDCPNVDLVRLFSDTNEIHLIDLYRNVKYRFVRNNEEENTNSDEEE